MCVIDGLSVVSRWAFGTARVAGTKVGRDSDDDVFVVGASTKPDGMTDVITKFRSFHAS